MLRHLSVLFLGVLFVAPASAQDARPQPRPDAVHWCHSVERAYTRAAKEKKLVLWVVMRDGEAACRRMLRRVYKDPKIVARSRGYLVLPSSPSAHTMVTVIEGDKEIETCPHFRGCTCEEHRKIERELRARYEARPEIIVPQHVITDAAGKVLARKDYELDVNGLLALMLKAETAAGLAPKDPAAVADSADADAEAGADAPPPPDPAKMTSEDRRALGRLVAATGKDITAATRAFLEDASPAGVAGLIEVLGTKEIKKPADRIRVIRAAGSESFADTAKAFSALLDSRNKDHRNATVVTLEEMKNREMATALLEMWDSEKDAEIKKDILRALGPVGAGNDKALKLLHKQSQKGNARNKIAAIVALGHHLSGQEDVRKDLVKTYKKGKGQTKTAVLYAYWVSKDRDVSPDIDGMMERERSKDMKTLGEVVQATLEERAPELGGGGGRGGRRGGLGGLLGGFRALRGFYTLFEKDKFPRNEVQSLLDRFGRGGR